MLIVAASPAIDPGAGLRARLTGFSGFLRANGYGVGGADSVSVLETSVQTGILDQQILRWSLKALLCGRGDEWRRFDALFDAYFLPPNKKYSWKATLLPPPRGSRPLGCATVAEASLPPVRATGSPATLTLAPPDTGRAAKNLWRPRIFAS